jgi:hypothetical protein
VLELFRELLCSFVQLAVGEVVLLGVGENLVGGMGGVIVREGGREKG